MTPTPPLPTAGPESPFSCRGAQIDWRGQPVGPEVPVSLAIGIFDGVHRGHQSVLASAAQFAASVGGIVAVLTFRPHPSRILRPKQPTELIFDPARKSERLFAAGVEAVVWKTFDAAFAGLTAEDFVGFLGESFPTLRSVHVGENFRFGRGRAGDPETMAEALKLKGVEVRAVPRFRWSGDYVSSSRLRQDLRHGQLKAVREMLGAPYSSRGVVQAGKRLGRTVGFPTLNFAHVPECRPRYGVYAVRALDAAGCACRGVANYGLRPTVEATDAPLLEVHLLEGPVTWTEGDELTVEWLEFLRPEQTFASLDGLKAQIANDVEAARARFPRILTD